MFENEEWREVEDFPNYLVSNYGRVKHKDRNEARKVTVNAKGFPTVVLFKGEGYTRYLRHVNQLVATAFLPEPTREDIPHWMSGETLAIWHIDGDLTNCCVDNLRWDVRRRVLEWNEMHRIGRPLMPGQGRCKNNRTGIVYDSVYDCAMAEGDTEAHVWWLIDKAPGGMFDDESKYRLVLD